MNDIPKTVKVAGVIWYVYGILTLLMLIIVSLSLFTSSESKAMTNYYMLPVFFVFGVSFFIAGRNTRKGKIKDVLVFGIISILLSLLAIPLLFNDATSSQNLPTLGVASILFLSGCLALFGRNKYKNILNNNP